MMGQVELQRSDHLISARSICQKNQYGGFVFAHQTFYFRAQGFEQLGDLSRHQTSPDVTLILCRTFEEHMIDRIIDQTQIMVHTNL